MSDTDGTLEQLAALPTMAHPTVSPDGETVALYYDISGRNELHTIDIETGESEQVSDGEVPRDARWHVEWSADGEDVFFHLDDDGDEQNDIHTLDLDGGAEPVVEMDGQVTIHDVDENGETLLFGSNRDGQMNVFSYDLDSGETTKLTEYERAVWGSLLSPDGDRIAYSTNESDDYDNVDVYVADADGSNARNLHIGDDGAESSPVDWHPDGDALLVSDNSEDLDRAGVYDLESDEVTWFGGLEYEEEPQFFLPDGERFVTERSREAGKVPVVYDTETGESREFDVPDGVASFGRAPAAGDPVVDENRVVLLNTSPTRRPEILLYDIESDEYEVLLEAEYGNFSPEEFADAEYFTVHSDGVPETPAEAVDHDPYDELEIGALFYDSGVRPSPLIVNPHGGPRHHDTKSFDLYTQFLVSRGFSVLQVNYRGSTGHGREFVEELYDDWGGAEQGDVATAAEHVLDEYDWLDEDRVVVFGGSYGGYSAYWQMVQYPELYDAGIAWIGVSDLRDMYENTMPHFRSELMVKYLGHPEDNPEIYDERSPSTHAGNLDSPLLIIHGANDPRVPVSQARIFREKLDDAGFEEGETFEYQELGEEGHASSDIDRKIRTFEILDDFLDRRIDSERGTLAAADD
jgi:dipeptidyl aminopeptidase/acylaminoacyl peptidase